jgi:hypothetical protein
MANTYTWTVISMDCYPQEGGNIDVVCRVNWECTGTDGRYSGRVYGTGVVPAPSGTFTPYDQLTQNQVLGWIWANGVDKVANEALVASQIQNQINPPVVTPPLPWVA